MRLFLHGRLGTVNLLDRIETASRDEIEHERFCSAACSMSSMPVPLSPSSSSSLSSSPNSRYFHTSLLLSNWDMDEMDQEVVDALETFLRIPCQQEQQQHHHHQPAPQIELLELQHKNKNQPCHEILASSSFSSSRSSLTNHELHPDADDSREVILQNCKGGERLEHFLALLMETNSALTVRYDKQQTMPVHLARGLLRGAQDCSQSSHKGDGEDDDDDDENNFCRLRSIALKGTTITPLAANYLQMTLPLLPHMEELTLQGNFILSDLDKKKSSIVGNSYSKMVRVVESLHTALQSLPRLKHLDLQRCHLPDEFLADILEAVDPESIETLKLNGNMAHSESQHVLGLLLSDGRCRLRHLDLSWQRLPNAKRNRSVLDVGRLAAVLVDQNTSLATLELSENILLDEDVFDLAMVLSIHPGLSRVSLQDCHIGDRGMVALAHHLARCKENLKNVYLDGKQGVRDTKLVRKTFFESLLRNVYLRELALPGTVQNESTDWALELNRAGRRALLQPDERDCSDPAIECKLHASPSFDSQTGTNHIPDGLWPRVLERADRIARREYLSEDDSAEMKAASAVYLLLREKGYHAALG
ncbi:unnamed protein product [Pseudo-nitzschia multistriata]|uniref:Uncharacterized protein n=1 Tax=Pseudo-nitzschia multistriata TaxID=183589 RepID=A0A448ZC56_9STRA|nr:unnamed protein product [Pseudo-nitzschia multistriata]